MFKTVGGFLFFFKWISRYFNFMVPKFALHNKIINKTRKLKNQENSAHHFEDKYLANHLMKLPKDGIRH